MPLRSPGMARRYRGGTAVVAPGHARRTALRGGGVPAMVELAMAEEMRGLPRGIG